MLLKPTKNIEISSKWVLYRLRFHRANSTHDHTLLLHHLIIRFTNQIRIWIVNSFAFYKKWKTFKHTFSSLLSNCSHNFSTNFGQCVPTTATTCTCFSVDRKLVTLRLCFKELIEKHLAPKNKYKQTMVSVLLSMICCPMCGNIDTMCGNINTVITSNSLLIWSKMAHTS